MKSILFVDDDARFRQTIQRQYGRRYEIEIAGDAEEARTLLSESGPFAVVVSDYQIPGENGIQLLESIKRDHPDVIRVLMAGRPDMQIAIDAVNHGSVFRLLTKPTTTQTLCRCLDASLRQHELLLSEDKFRDETLRGTVEILTKILALTNPVASSRSRRLKALVGKVMDRMELPDTWACETAAVLSQIGWVGLPTVLLAKRDAGITLAATEQQMIDGVPRAAAALLRSVPRLDTIARLIESTQDFSRAETETERTLARILAVCSDLDQRLARGSELDTALTQTLRAAGDLPEAVAEGFRSINEIEVLDTSFTIAISSVKSGWVLDQDVVTKEGTKLLGRGHVLSGSALVRLRAYVAQERLEDFVQVRRPSSRSTAA